MAYEYTIERRVEFSETDMAGLMHFSNFFRYMESAEHAFFRSLGFSVVMDQVDPPVGWPRVHAHCDYRHPARFEDMIQVRLIIRKITRKSLTYAFRFRRRGESGWEEIAQGSLTTVCVQRESDGRISATEIPPEFARHLETAPPEIWEKGL